MWQSGGDFELVSFGFLTNLSLLFVRCESLVYEREERPYLHQDNTGSNVLGRYDYGKKSK